MASSLIVFTPRSGSTIVAELLAYKHNSINLDEILTGRIRGVLRNKLHPDAEQLLSTTQSDDLLVTHGYLNTQQGSIEDYNICNKRFEASKLIYSTNNIVLKYYPNFHTPGVKIVQWAIDNNFEIYFLTRKSPEEQLYSYVLAHAKENFYRAAQRAGRLSMHHYAGFLNIKNAPRVVFPPTTVEKKHALDIVCTLCSINNAWQAYYNRFKHCGKLVYYEDSILKKDFSDFGVSAKIYNQYSSQQLSVQPSHEYNMGSQITNWDELLEIFNEYNTVRYE